MNLKTTYKKIRNCEPCTEGWEKLLKNCNPEHDMEKQVSLLEILDSNGIKDAIWSLQCWEYRDYCLLLADIAESVLHIWTTKYPDDNRPALAIQAIRDWHAGKITDQQLQAAYTAAAYTADAYAAYAAAAYAAADAAYAAADAADAAADAAKQLQWKKIENLMREFIKEEK